MVPAATQPTKTARKATGKAPAAKRPVHTLAPAAPKPSKPPGIGDKFSVNHSTIAINPPNLLQRLWQGLRQFGQNILDWLGNLWQTVLGWFGKTKAAPATAPAPSTTLGPLPPGAKPANPAPQASPAAPVPQAPPVSVPIPSPAPVAAPGTPPVLAHILKGTDGVSYLVTDSRPDWVANRPPAGPKELARQQRAFELVKDLVNQRQSGQKPGHTPAQPFALYSELIEEKYEAIRKSDYTSNPIHKAKHEADIDSYTGANASGMTVDPINWTNPWHYRQPINKAGWTPDMKQRVSANVYGCRQLIDDLDKLFTVEGFKGYYKTPYESEKWAKRHDPITIYLHQKLTPKQEKRLAEVLKPYIRSNADVLPGRKLIPGVSLEEALTPQEILDTLNKAYALDPTFAGVLVNKFRHQDVNGNRITLDPSTGTYNAALWAIRELSKVK